MAISLEIDDEDLKLHRPVVQPSTFHFVCICGGRIATTEREGVCKGCGREYDITAWGRESAHN